MVDGIATSATLMVPCPWAREAARMLEGLTVGVHLTLTCEYLGYRWRGLTGGASLHDDEGFLPATSKAALERVDAADARAECQAQLETALAWSVDVTHLDTHMNVLQSRTDLYEIYLDLAEAFRLPVRMFSREDTEKQGFQARERAEARGLLFNEHLVYPWPRRTREVFFEEIPKLPPGVSAIFAHPVLDGEELRAYDTKNADIRAHDAVCLMDPTVADLLDQHDIRRIAKGMDRFDQSSTISKLVGLWLESLVMKTVGTFEAKTHLSALLEQVERGEEITITKHGKAVARLVPVGVVSRGRLDATVAQLKAFRRGRRLVDLSAKDLIEEGRR